VGPGFRRDDGKFLNRQNFPRTAMDNRRDPLRPLGTVV